MRKSILIAILMSLLLSACSGGIGVEREILGSWQSEGGLFNLSQKATFTSNKELILEGAFGTEEVIEYAIIAPGKMRLGKGADERVVQFDLQGDQLALELDGGMLTFTRVLPPPPQALQNTAAPEKAAEVKPQNSSGAESPQNTPVPFSQSAGSSAGSSAGNSAGSQDSPPPFKPATDERFITPTPRVYHPINNCAASQLHKGDTAFISWDTTPNALRTTPDTHPSNNFVDNGRVPPGGVLEVLDGPVCNYGWVLWYVRTTWDVEGWTPETDGNEFWMLPIATRQLCKDSKPTRLIAGKKAFVEEEPNDPVEVYKEMVATINDPSSILYRIPIKEQVDLLEGPFCDGKGANWWRVRTRTNVEGYIRENDKIKDYYFMAPVP